ncbi:MAG: nucleoside-diphosphate-sugar epimerase [Candidatus Azotimanducaceae bacterium]
MITVVTGANGFVGSWLVNSLVAAEIDVCACYRTSAIQVVQGVTAHHVGNIDESTDWLAALENADNVIHCAARVHVMNDNSLDPLSEFRRVNVGGTLNLARQAVAAGVRRFIYLSSIKVNGDGTTKGEQYTAADVVHPEDPYGISKCEAEEGLRQISRETGLEVVIVRPPLVYGVGAKGNFAALARVIKKGFPLPLGSLLNNRRSLVSLNNLVDFLTLCLAHPKAANETFLVSDGEDLSTRGLIEEMAKALGCPIRLLPFPVGVMQLAAQIIGKGDVARRVLGSLQVDINKNRELLGWVPSVSVAEGLKVALQDV